MRNRFWADYIRKSSDETPAFIDSSCSICQVPELSDGVARWLAVLYLPNVQRVCVCYTVLHIVVALKAALQTRSPSFHVPPAFVDAAHL